MLTADEILSKRHPYSPTEEEFLEWFSVLQAGWVHNGDPKNPHVYLASKKHSSGFFLCKRILKYPNLREIVAASIIARLEAEFFPMKFNGVFGAPYSSITLAAEVGRLLNIPNYIVEKGPKENGQETMVFKADDPPQKGSCLLEIEELVTTSGSGMKAAEAIQAICPEAVFPPFIGVFVHRPSERCRFFPDGRKIVSVIERIVDNWDPSECPLCKQGSEALEPKGQNWAKLTGK